MQQHVYCLGYVSFVLVTYSLPGLVLYRLLTRPKMKFITWGIEKVRSKTRIMANFTVCTPEVTEVIESRKIAFLEHGILCHGSISVQQLAALC